MSKRGAEKQLTDRNWDREDDDGDDDATDGAFAVAPPAALAQRRIRGMPQRKTAAPSLAAPPSIDTAPKSSPFATGGAFGGFSFASSAATAATPVANRGVFDTDAVPPSAFSFGSPSSTSAFGSASPSGPSPFSTSPFNFETAPAPAAQSRSVKPIGVQASSASPPQLNLSSAPNHEAAVQYYMSLRALNLALIKALRDKIEDDPFLNLIDSKSGSPSGLTTLSNRYEHERARIEGEFQAVGGHGDVFVNGREGSRSKVNGSRVHGNSSRSTEVMEIESPQPVKPLTPSSIPSIFTSPPTSAPSSPMPFLPPPVPQVAKRMTSIPSSPATFSWAENMVKQPSDVPSTKNSFGDGAKSALSEKDEYANATTTALTDAVIAPPTVNPAVSKTFTSAIQSEVKEPEMPFFSIPSPPSTFSWAGNIVKPPSSFLSTTAHSEGGFKPILSSPKKGTEKGVFSFPVSSKVPSMSEAGNPARKTTSDVPPVNPSNPVPSININPEVTSKSAILPTKNTRASSVKLANVPTAPSPLRYGESLSPESVEEKASLPGKLEENTEIPAVKKGTSGFSFGASFGRIATGGAVGAQKEKEKEEQPEDNHPSNPFSTSKSADSSSSLSSTSAPISTLNSQATPFSFNTPISSPSSAFTSTSTSSISIPAPASATKETTSSFTFGGFGSQTSFKTSSGPSGTSPLATAFGTGTSPPSFSFGAALGNRAPAPFTSKSPGFSFGNSASTAATNYAAINSTGFSFGGIPAVPSPKVTMAGPSAEPSTNATAAKTTSGFSFGSPSAVTPGSQYLNAFIKSPSESGADETSTSAATAEDAGNDAEDSPGENPLAGRGEGEEGEETLLESRGKVVRLDSTGPKDVGVATILVKVRESEGRKVRRLLARNEVTGSVLMNFRLGPQFQVKMEKTFLTFLGFEGTEPQMFRLRLKTKEQTEELKEELERAAKDAAS